MSLAVLAPLVLGGCGEIGSMLDAGAGKDAKAAKSEKAAAGGTAREKLDAYYNREPRRVEQDPNDPLVSCRLHGKTQFMRKSDCTLRGGSASA